MEKKRKGGSGPNATLLTANGLVSLGFWGKERKRKEWVGWVGRTGRVGTLVGPGEHSGPFIQHRGWRRIPALCGCLNGLTQQHKHTPVAVTGPSVSSCRPAGHT